MVTAAVLIFAFFGGASLVAWAVGATETGCDYCGERGDERAVAYTAGFEDGYRSGRAGGVAGLGERPRRRG